MTPYIPRPGFPVGLDPDWHLERPAGQAVVAIDLPTAASTHAFGRDRLAPLLEPGDLVIASGPLGAGKTTLVQGIGAGLHVDGPVLSPTFVIARVHRGGRLPLVHVDAYRLRSVQEVDDLDLDADLAQSVTVVEWGAGLVEHLADEHLLIELSLSIPPGGLPANRQVVGGVEGGGLPANRQGDAGNESALDEVRVATLTGYGPRWQARLRAGLP